MSNRLTIDMRIRLNTRWIPLRVRLSVVTFGLECMRMRQAACTLSERSLGSAAADLLLQADCFGPLVLGAELSRILQHEDRVAHCVVMFRGHCQMTTQHAYALSPHHASGTAFGRLTLQAWAVVRSRGPLALTRFRNALGVDPPCSVAPRGACPDGYAVDGDKPTAIKRNRAFSVQLAGRCTRIRLACSTTRAAILSKRRRNVLNSAFASA
jgi:hypothetical protein